MQKENREQNTLGETIRMLRLQKHLSQEQLAEISGVSRSTIDLYERTGVKQPKASVLLRLADALEQDPSVLFSAAGLGGYISTKMTTMKIKDLLSQLIFELPAEVPVYDTFKAVCNHIGKRLNIEPINIIYRSKEDATKSLEAYVVENSDMEPLIESGDIVVIDRALKPAVGDIVLCLLGEERTELIGKVLTEDDVVKVVNKRLSVRLEDCSVCCVVITMRRNFVVY